MKMQRKRVVLAVDDDELNLMILVKNITAAGYQAMGFASGDAAWEYLTKNPTEVDIAVLDKMMPGMNGIELLGRIKGMEALRHMPVIMQTGDVGIKQMCEGLESGAFYYLTKPFHPEIFTAILHSAGNECLLREELNAQMTGTQSLLSGMLQEAEFSLRTHSEARLLAATLAQSTARSEFVARSFMELFANAIEHGNLAVGYEQKHVWLLSGRWEQEIKARAEDPIYGKRMVRVRMEKMGANMHLIIRDEGAGFDWRNFLSSDATIDILNKPSGRGIMLAMGMLDSVQFRGMGNEVHCSVGMPSHFSLNTETIMQRLSHN